MALWALFIVLCSQVLWTFIKWIALSSIFWPLINSKWTDYWLDVYHLHDISFAGGLSAGGIGTLGQLPHGIYDPGPGFGLSGFDRQEALTASYLYPELLNVTSAAAAAAASGTMGSRSVGSRRPRLLRTRPPIRPPSSNLSLSSSSVSSSTTVSSFHQYEKLT